MFKVLLAVVGITMLFMSSRHMFLTLRDGSFLALGNRRIRRKSRPVFFWMNFGALAFVSVIGVALIGAALLIAN